MTREDIIRMANEANLPACHLTHPKALERFAKLVAEHERNACIEAADNALTNEWEGVVDAVNDIKARGEQA